MLNTPNTLKLETPKAQQRGNHMGGCTLNIRCRIIIGIQKGTIIVITTHMYIYIYIYTFHFLVHHPHITPILSEFYSSFHFLFHYPHITPILSEFYSSP